jgi:hypothetical protein
VPIRSIKVLHDTGAYDCPKPELYTSPTSRLVQVSFVEHSGQTDAPISLELSPDAARQFATDLGLAAEQAERTSSGIRTPPR